MLSGSGAGAQGGPAEAGDVLPVLAGFGAGVMTGPNALEEGCISPRLPPCQPPVAAQPTEVGGPAGDG